MANYEDIARLAKVSIATVSHVINNTRFVEPETKHRVLNAIDELKYRPNLYARGLAMGKTNTIGLVISDIRNPFYPELIQGTEEVARENGYDVFLSNIGYENEKIKKSIEALISRKIDGIVLATSQIEDSIIEEILNYKINFVMVDLSNRDIEVDSIVFDYGSGIEEALDYLISLDHRDIYFISGPKEQRASMVRINNFIGAVLKHEDKKINYKIIEGDHRLSGGYNAAKKMVKENDYPTAVMCSNDLTAIGAMQSFIEDGVKIPEEISIIGFDNIQLSEIFKPHLTTIELNRYKIGSTLMELLLKRINNKNSPIQKIVFQTRMIKRGSVERSRKNK